MLLLDTLVDGREHFFVLGESVELALREDEIAVGNHFKDSATGLDELGVDAVLALEVGRQTGGLGLIVSLNAVLDRNVHRGSPSRKGRGSYGRDHSSGSPPLAENPGWGESGGAGQAGRTARGRAAGSSASKPTATEALKCLEAPGARFVRCEALGSHCRLSWQHAAASRAVWLSLSSGVDSQGCAATGSTSFHPPPDRSDDRARSHPGTP